ncbi:MAG TPA: chemotaxis protein CheA [Smithellaceae bacterium]|nr:chemotaxis protein CheA [Smithellaceae bacterium]
MTPLPSDPVMMDSFLDDYYAECDEHMTAIRRNVLDLEASLGKAPLNMSGVEELFRSFHTIKGLSGMVGLKDAEHLSHRIENFLNALRGKKATLSPATLDTLIAGINLLEKVMEAHKSKSIPPSIQDMTRRLEELLPAEENDSPQPQAARRVPEPETSAEARPHGGATWIFEFQPSPELAERGINVNRIRSRLEGFGKIIKASPQMLPSGGVAFEFVVSAAGRDEPPAEWSKDGLTFFREEGQKAPEGSPDRVASSESPAAAGPDVGSITSTGISPVNIVRVDLARLDEMMRLVGELVISRARLEDGLDRLETEVSAAGLRPLQEADLAMGRQLRDLREAVMRVRMVPVGEIFNRMQFVVRDVARENRKQVRLELAGQETEIDKLIVERMMDPLLHLVRNAIGHGLEGPEERLSQGKTAEGRLTLRAAAAGDTVVLEVEDDGAGMDCQKIAEQAKRQGMVARSEKPDEKDILDILCTSGFSTRSEADLTSGRGVGLAVVRNAVEELGGTMEMTTAPGKGTNFVMRLPLTLAIADALIVSVGDQTFAVPQAVIHEVIEIPKETVTVLENNEIIPYRGGVLPLIRLARFFHLPQEPGRSLYGMVVGTGPSGAVLVVDKIVGRREIVVRATTDPLLAVPGVAGATELGDGRVVLILDTAKLKAEAGGKR